MSFCSARFLLLLGSCFAFTSAAHAGPPMFEASFRIDTFDYPLPVSASATGSGSISVSSISGIFGSIALPQSAFAVTTGALTWWSANETSFNVTYATFANDAGSFFSGGGPAAGMGTLSHTAGGTLGGRWVIFEGKKHFDAFGGALGMLGKLGAYAQFAVDDGKGQPNVFNGSTSWNMIRALGRSGLDPLNPYTNLGVFTSTKNPMNTTLRLKFGSGTGWTTGTAKVYVETGAFTTSISVQGYDTWVVADYSFPHPPRNWRYLQLVTPGLTHWRGAGGNNDSGHIGVLRLRIDTPEPGPVLMLAVGAGVLALLHRVSRRR